MKLMIEAEVGNERRVQAAVYRVSLVHPSHVRVLHLKLEGSRRPLLATINDPDRCQGKGHITGLLANQFRHNSPPQMSRNSLQMLRRHTKLLLDIQCKEVGLIHQKVKALSACLQQVCNLKVHPVGHWCRHHHHRDSRLKNGRDRCRPWLPGNNVVIRKAYLVFWVPRLCENRCLIQ